MYRSQAGVNPETGKWPLTFSISTGYADLPVTVPCGQCIGCRLERSRQWAMRCVFEASLWPRNCFLTLTFDDIHIDPSFSLVKADFVNFMKRLRFRFGSGIRFFHCGEYGSINLRPHHHAIIFNHDFDDKVFYSSKLGIPLYRSPSLESLWPFGFSTIGDVTFESAAYVARYILKKITGDDAADHYQGRLPEYVTMSRRPGVGRAWYSKFKSDVYPHDYVVIRGGLKCKPPKYYDNIYDNESPELLKLLKRLRSKKLKAFASNNTIKRLQVREKLQYLRADMLDRMIEI
jgi:hypothetical protein